ncbi:spore wall synthesis complex protein [Phycicoccus ginsengisoli]
MPLSEHEQQLLEQMEQALYAEDPKFASQMQGAGARAAQRRRIIVAVVGVVVGLAVVLVGVKTQLWVLGAVGFALMVASVTFALTPQRRRARLGSVQSDGTIRRTSPAARTKSARGGGSFMERMEQRWDRRHDGY